MPEQFHQYNLTKTLKKKYSHTTYLASPVNGPEHQVFLIVWAAPFFRLLRESKEWLLNAERIQHMQHPHILPILDMGIHEGQPFLVREYLPHDSLRSHLREISSHRLELQEALTIILEVGQALTYAHQRNIIHGNIKPENILFNANGHAVLTDFNLVSRKDAVIRDQTSEEYAFCYLAPEQFAGTCDARSDQYALGCLTYELITGRVPFAAQSLASMMGQPSNALPAPLSESVADLPPSLEAAVLKTLAKDPDERFFDFSLFLDVIQSIVSLSPVFPFTNAPHSPRTRTRSHSRQSAKADIVASPIRKRVAKPSASEQPESSPALYNAVADLREPAEIGAGASEYEATSVSDARMTSPDTLEPGTSSWHDDVVFPSEPDSLANQADSQESADDGWLTHLFEEQESNDTLAIGSASLGYEQHESSRDTRDETIVSLHRDMPLRRRVLPNWSKVLGLVLLCFVMVASGIYAVLPSLKATSKPNLPVHPIQTMRQAPVTPVQNSLSPTPLTVLATPTVPIRPTPQITTVPSVIPTAAPPRSYEAEAPQNTLTGGAAVSSCSFCSGGYDVVKLGNSNDSTLQFNNINKNVAGEYNLTIYYINGENKGTGRGLYVSINGQVARTYYLAGDGTWSNVQLFSVTVSLNAGNNTIKFFNPNYWTPDIDRIVV